MNTQQSSNLLSGLLRHATQDESKKKQLIAGIVAGLSQHAKKKESMRTRSLSDLLSATKTPKAKNDNAWDWYIKGNHAYYDEENYEEAVRCYRKAADMGVADAQYELGICYHRGDGVAQDDEMALKWWLLAAEQNHTHAENEIGDWEYEAGNYDEAFMWYNKALEHDEVNWWAMYNLAWCYHKAQGTIRDAEKALKWYSEAASFDYGPALYQLGVFHEFGFMGNNGEDLVKVDIEKAKEYYDKAAKNGSSGAADALADLQHVYNDTGDREYWYQKGIEAFENDERHKAARWWRRAAEAGHVEAQCKLGECYAGYSGFERVYSEGIKWYTKAANGGSAAGQYHLGMCYSGGWGVQSNKRTAFKWYMKAADQGHVDAQYWVAYAYEEGEGVKKNGKKAIEWYQIAAANGDEAALDKLDELGARFVAYNLQPELTQTRWLPLFLNVLLLLIAITAIVLVRRMDQMTFRSISEEEAIEMAQELKVSLPDQEIKMLDSGKAQKLKTGTKVKVLGVYKAKLNKGNSPRVYWTNQSYLIELADGTRGYGPLMETAIGQHTVLPEGDTVVITAIKKLKKAPKVQATGKDSRFDYAYTLEGRKEQYALEALHIHFPQRVAYLGNGLRKEDFTVANDSIDEDMSIGQRAKKFFLYDIRPYTKKNGFFLFPKYQSWNEFQLQRWFRTILIVLAYIAEIVIVFEWLPRLIGKFKENRHKRKLKRRLNI